MHDLDVAALEFRSLGELTSHVGRDDSGRRDGEHVQ